MEKDQINSLAEKIARVISAEPASADLVLIRKNLDSINDRLTRLESAQPPQHSSNNISTSIHPSEQRFAVAEAIVDSLFNRDTTKEKTCAFEPNDRPCDHCSMCSSRGF